MWYAVAADTAAEVASPTRESNVPQSPTNSTRLLVVDDEGFIADLLSSSLTYAGFEVQTAGSGTEALAAVPRWRPELILLDVQMPDLDGFEVCRQLRAMGVTTPVLFLTARDSTEDKVAGLAEGGDDYVTKPFALDEVVARIHAILRRTATAAGGAPPGMPDAELRFADLVLNQDSHQVWRAGELIHLSRTEFAMLRFLMLNLGRVLSKAQFLDHVWDYDFGGNGAIVESYVSYLRKKIDQVDPPLIQTVRGVGYTMRLPHSSGPPTASGKAPR
ncbi:MAG: response regulator transcription factor [Nocardioides sp.]